MNLFSSIHKRASALLLVLAAITTVSVLVVTLLLVSKYERTSSHIALIRAQSESLADIAADTAISKMREAIADGMQPRVTTWISEPGRIRVCKLSNPSSFTDYPLFSALPGADSSTQDLNNVDLNRPSITGDYPIAPPAPNKTAATMKIGWINLPADPNNSFSKSNPVIGRIAYWVDDESCKININTADGSHKKDLYRSLSSGEKSLSFGFGTPTEISLEALTDSSGSNLTNTLAAAIRQYAWDKGFNSAAEINRISGLPSNFYKKNKFNLTHYSKIPELTFYGEPRIYLMPVLQNGTSKIYTLTPLTGPYKPQVSAFGTVSTGYSALSEAINFVYPTSPQLPKGTYDYPVKQLYADGELPQYPLELPDAQKLVSTNPNFPFVSRIAQALAGKDSLGNTIQWPAFTSGSFATKYNSRQIDSIALQILDICHTAFLADHIDGFSLPTIATAGIQQTAPVIGLGRTPKLTELVFRATTGTMDIFGTGAAVPYIQPYLSYELYFPRYYQGVPLNMPYANVTPWRVGNYSITSTPTGGTTNVLNENDISTDFNSPSPLGGYWQDNILQVNGGIDFRGNNYKISSSTYLKDPDQTRAAAEHAPYAYNATLSAYMGSMKTTAEDGRLQPFFSTGSPAATTSSWPPGLYHSQDSNGNGAYLYPGKIGTGTFTFSGGIAFWTHDASHTAAGNYEVTPLDSIRGSIYTGETNSTIKSVLQKAVVPVEFSVSVPEQKWYSARVADPLVNKFPGDWKKTTAATSSGFTIELPSLTNVIPSLYCRSGGYDTDSAFSNASLTQAITTKDGDNAEFKPANGGDPLSLWLPRQDVRYPKLSRFPSVGALNYVRTGMIPDDLSVDLSAQHGTPWRSINLGASSRTSQTVGSTSYPDWAMLDLFTVPCVLQSPYFTTDVATPKRMLTSGGATEGKININNPKVPYPFSVSISGVTQTPPERTAPLDALFYGIQTSTQYDGNGDPVYTTVDATKLRDAVQSYLSSTGSFLLPGQLAEVGAINDYCYTGVDAKAVSRNDLMRQIVGAATTQSNVFSIWVVAQTVQKNKGNTDYTKLEAGDVITGETRRRYTVERFIETGKDGVPGNAVNPGTDGIVGTEDDPIDTDYNPAMTYPLPYRWRIVAVEDINH